MAMLCFLTMYDKEDSMDKSLVEKPNYGNWVAKKFVYIPKSLRLPFMVGTMGILHGRK
jgi:hypothetical protein